MELKGKVFQVGEVNSGTNNRGTWKSVDIIIEQSDDYKRKALITVVGDKVDSAASLIAGQDITFHVNVEAREYQGKWYNSVRGWKWETNVSAPTTTHASSSTKVDIVQDDDLPF
jgi:hypothetical protein